MLRIALTIALSVLLLGSAAAQSSPTRIALVIGNGSYSAVDPLPNATGDADLVAAQLRRLRFDVVFKPDLNRQQLAEEIERFGARLRAAGPDAVSFFFYSGHAAQDHMGVNYLVPTNATARTPEALRDEATPLQAIFDDMQAANNPVNVLVLDACRDWYEDAREQRVVSVRGLHDMGRHGNVFIGLATTPGFTTNDGDGDNSPYTTRLVEALGSKANQPLSLLFDDVGALVYSDTDAAQTPEFLNGLVRAPRWCLEHGSGCANIEVRPPAPVLANAFLQSLDRPRLLEFTRDNVSFVDALLARRELLAANGIHTHRRLSFFLATVAFETANFRSQSESLNFNAERLRQIFPDLFDSDAVAARYAGQPERIANRIYAGQFRNGDEASGDGWRYRGRGLFLLTGRANYTRVSDWIGLDLAATPDLIQDPEVNLAAAAAFWNRGRLNEAADANDLRRVAQAMGGPGAVAQSIDYRAFLLRAAIRATEPSSVPSQ